MEIREARPEEYPRIGELTAQAYLDDGHVTHDDGYLAVLRDAAARARGALLLVAVDGDQLLGTVTFCPAGSPWRELAADDEGEFRTLAVAPGARGRGVGEALVRRCVELSSESGNRGVVLSTLPDQVRAHRVYERIGFLRDPLADWSPLPGVELLAYRLTH